MNRENFNSLLQRYLSGQCTESERRYVESWFEATQQTEVQDLDLSQQALLRDKLWNSIEGKLDTHTKQLPSFNYWRISRIAAALVLFGAGLFSFSYYLRSPSDAQTIAVLSSKAEMVTISNGDSTVREVKLKDGSKVLLHPGSEILYPVTFGSLREVYLTGEAFFEIEKDPAHPFLVHAGEVTTRVLGTSFLVQAYREQKEIKVAVTSGRVSVLSKSAESFFKLWTSTKEVILTPNQQLVYNRHEKTSQTQLVNNPRMLVPDASKELVYTNEPVTKLFKTLEKIYGVTIQHDEKIMANCTITTEMTSEGLFERMDVICHVLNASYSVNGTMIVVESTGCSN